MSYGLPIALTPSVWYRDRDSLKLGEVNRYKITYTRQDPNITKIYLVLKNMESPAIRPMHLLNGPFILYTHVVPCNYDRRKPFIPEDPENNEVLFDNQLQPNQKFKATLCLNENSQLSEAGSSGEQKFQWEVDVVSQIAISRKSKISYDLMIGEDLTSIKKLGLGKLRGTLSRMSSFNSANSTISSRCVEDSGKVTQQEDMKHVIYNPQLDVTKLTTEEMWDNKPKDPQKPVHLVLITHGLFSNVTADMLYIKETLESSVKENILVRGYRWNAGFTERGIRKLGKNVALYVISLIESGPYTIDRISFIAHSLGGLVQFYAIKYIALHKGVDYFEKYGIQLENLIAMASPLLGILNEISFVISWVLDIGTLGRTGRELTLSKRIPTFGDVSVGGQKKSFKPLLETLPDDPLQTILSKFKHLTVYANAINDGIVPLRTSALLYLDYQALGEVSQLKRKEAIPEHPELEDPHHPVELNESTESVSEVQQDEDLDTQFTSAKAVADPAVPSKTGKNPPPGRMKDIYKELSKFYSSPKDDSRKPSRRQKRYAKFTLKGSDYNLFEDVLPEDAVSDSLSDPLASSSMSSNSTDFSEITVPPRASAIASAISVLICPVPSQEYIFNPDSRKNVIFHDKYYHFSNSPEEDPRASSKKIYNKLLNYLGDRKLQKQVKIANKLHSNKLTWRKVLVNLPPDAHTNIIVRRRFPNGYGWGVIDHLCENFFDCNGDEGDGGYDKNLRAKI
ncbi:uncharacterized protein J8A68_001700 [[Candida] subhashii]|uniref:DUF676 domain-containing protein n=1 Tax=[Candida] subhashii TaxID=561895 RepID=A0A8J5UZ53_9ASCO|nr:uncharacterized protein J8A68_001700 [[Candida] subhashii]KAG7664745.1 hypothetical protein J8A68_001700 [[Candida] subhashii]